MRKMGILATVVLLLAIGLQGWGLSICEYRAPRTALTDARLSFSYRYYDSVDTVGVDVNSGRLAFDYDQLFDSPNYGFSLGGAAELTLDAFLPTGWLGQGSATFRYYPMEESLLFAFGGLEASMATGQPRPGIDVRVGVGVEVSVGVAVPVGFGLEDREAVVGRAKPHPADPDLPGEVVARLLGRDGHHAGSTGAPSPQPRGSRPAYRQRDP